MKVIVLAFLLAAQRDSLPVRTLDSVNVTHKRTAVQESVRGAVLDIAKIADVQFLSLAQALREIPGIAIEEETRSITYLGKPMAILKDGVNVAGFSELLRNGLNAPALNFKKVTLNIYDLKTEGPTLSFTEERHDEGVFGNAGGSIGTNQSMVSTSLSVSKRRQLFNLAPSVNMMFTPAGTNRLTTTRSNREDVNVQQQSGIRTGSYGLNASGAWTLPQGKQFNSSVSFRRTDMHYRLQSMQEQWRHDTLYSSMRQAYQTANPFGPQNQTFNWNNTFTWKKASQRWDAALELSNERSGNEQQSTPLLLKGPSLPASHFSNRRYEHQNGIFALLAYEKQHAKAGNFETVLKYFFRQLDHEQLYQFRGQPQGPDSLEEQTYRIHYHYAALLSSWDKHFRQFSLRAVMKADYSHDKASDATAREQFSFFTVSPYISFFREMKNSSLRTEFQFGQLRPQLAMLTSMTRYGEQYGASGVQTKGNPGLRPSTKWSAGAVYHAAIKIVTLNVTGNYALSKDDIQSYYYIEDSVLTNRYQNLARSRQADVSLGAAAYLFPRFQASVSAGARWVQFKPGDTARLQRRANWRQQLQLSYTLSPRWRMSAGVNYQAGYALQVKMAAQVYSNYTITYVQGRFTCGLQLHNFHEPVMTLEKTTYGDEYTMTSRSRSRQLRATVNANYRFGKISKEAAKGKQIGKDDM